MYRRQGNWTLYVALMEIYRQKIIKKRKKRDLDMIRCHISEWKQRKLEGITEAMFIAGKMGIDNKLDSILPRSTKRGLVIIVILFYSLFLASLSFVFFCLPHHLPFTISKFIYLCCRLHFIIFILSPHPRSVHFSNLYS